MPCRLNSGTKTGRFSKPRKQIFISIKSETSRKRAGCAHIAVSACKANRDAIRKPEKNLRESRRKTIVGHALHQQQQNAGSRTREKTAPDRFGRALRDFLEKSPHV